MGVRTKEQRAAQGQSGEPTIGGRGLIARVSISLDDVIHIVAYNPCGDDPASRPDQLLWRPLFGGRRGSLRCRAQARLKTWTVSVDAAGLPTSAAAQCV